MSGMKQRDPALPRQVQIEPVGQCNLRCRMCLIRDRKQDRPAFMEMGLFKELLSQFAGAEELHLQGLGEPFLHPSFFDMARYATGQGLRVSTNTNLTVFCRQQAEACVLSGLNWIRVSIDGADPKTYESIRTGSRLENVLNNLELLSATKKLLGSELPRLHLVMVIMRRNIGELPELLRVAARYSIHHVFVQNLCNDFSGSGLREKWMRELFEGESLAGEDRVLVETIFREASALARDLKIDLRLPRLAPRSETGLKTGRHRCDWPWRSAYITYDGTAVPCCMIALPERANMGSMAQKGVRAIWNGEAYRLFRAQLDSDAPPSVCRSCSLYRGTF